MSKRSADTERTNGSAPMEQVRELLFGAQLKDMEARFQRQEERFLREITDARESFKQRLDSLENFMKSESATLLHRLNQERDERSEALKSEQRDRAEAVKAEAKERLEAIRSEQRERADALEQIARELAAAEEALERKIAKVSGMLDTTERELRQLLLSESGSLSAQITEKYQDALAVLSETASQIRHDMVHRSSLSTMFTETAVKLSGQWTPEVGMMFSAAEQPLPGTDGKDDSPDA